MKQSTVSRTLVSLGALAVALAILPSVSAQDPVSAEAAAISVKGMIAIGAGLAVGLAGIGTGIAQSSIGAAAVGATAEDPKNFGRALLFVALPETVVIFGFAIAFLVYIL